MARASLRSGRPTAEAYSESINSEVAPQSTSPSTENLRALSVDSISRGRCSELTPGGAATVWRLGSRRSHLGLRGSTGLRGGVSAIFGAFGVSEGGAGGLGASLVSGVESNKSSHSLYKHPKRLWDANEGAPLTRRGTQNPPVFLAPPRPLVTRWWSRAGRRALPANHRRAAELLRPARPLTWHRAEPGICERDAWGHRNDSRCG